MAAGTVRTYAPHRLTISVAGVLIQGYADADAVTIAPEAEDFVDVVGTDGEVSRAYQNDPRRLVTVRLAQTSPSNDYLSSLRRRAQLGQGDVGTVQVRDGSGTTVLEGPGWIQRAPDQSFGREVGTREWQIRVVARNETIGGNPAL